MRKAAKDNLEDLFQKAYASHQAGRFSAAKNSYRKLIKKKPDWGLPMGALGILYLDQDQADKARHWFEKAVRLTPPDLSACYQLGRMKQMDNDHEGAIPLYRQILDHQPDMGLAWNNLGLAFRETGSPEEALESFRKAVRFAPQMEAAWNNLGVALDEQGKGDDALEAYQKAIDIQPDYLSPHLNLGILLQKADQFEKAEKHYKKVLALQPENEIAQFMLQSIHGGDTVPDAAPVEHVRGIFNQCADDFETILVDELAYKTPQLLFNMVQPFLTADMEILDLGCGTGLGAALYQPFAKGLTGVDVSEKMLEKAEEKKIYTSLEVFDILQPWAFPNQFDLIYSSDVFVYFGNLDQIFQSAAASMAEGGIIAFSVEALQDDTQTFQLYPSGRYAHSQAYIATCLERHGLRRLALEQTDIRKQSGDPVKGFLVAAQK